MRPDISGWSARRVQHLTILVASTVVLAVALTFILAGWLWALLAAILLAVVVLRPLRRAIVFWWQVNGAE